MPVSTVQSSHRPTLPPIRDLFRDELASPNSFEPPQATLARLRVSDDADVDHPRRSSGTSEPSGTSRPHGHPSYRVVNHTRPQDGKTDRGHSSLQRSLSYQHSELHHSYHQYHAQTPADPRYPPHRDSVGTSDFARQNEPRYTLSPAYPSPMSSSHRVMSTSDSRAYPWPISTRVDRPHDLDDDERTPIARYPGQLQPHHNFRYPPHVEEPPPTQPSSNAKYECHYCRKGFNRPSSLKIHLNSHTGEKPFVCPVEGCGRSFSVLSNMRRHARVHTPADGTGKEKETSGDDSESSSKSQNQTGISLTQASDPKWYQRRGSIASSTSSSSRRSRSVSSDDDDEVDQGQRPEKRSRHVS
ncbi:hypothetical protein FA15DRAFT_593827 [Coprinopsis marcescibilis]|uniref:C2H2-type domain-containing protein n=1 Tax=Coprinopsis marcescibilis TaxID=230819 RepID=A0A5C3KSR5_COPMA|nr:hypothetical protein FA15DRAFT_593827 [Coprinopsis marcescibilis]